MAVTLMMIMGGLSLKRVAGKVACLRST